MLGIYWKDLESVRSQRWKDLCSRKILGSPASFPKMSTNRSDTPLITCAKHGVPAPCEDPTKNYSVSVELKNCSHILKNLQYKCQTIKINQKNMILPPFVNVTNIHLSIPPHLLLSLLLKNACGWPVKSAVDATNPWTCSLGRGGNQKSSGFNAGEAFPYVQPPYTWPWFGDSWFLLGKEYIW